MGVLLALGFAVLIGNVQQAQAAEPEGSRVISYSATPSTTQAGAHPDVTIEFAVGTRVDPLILGSCFCNTAKNINNELPAGFIGNPHAVAECTAAQFIFDECSPDAQVGYVKPRPLVSDGCCASLENTPIYNLVPQPGQAGLLGFKGNIFNFPIYEVVEARTGSDYGLNVEVRGITQFFAIASFKQVMWGVPAAPEHDALRFKKGGGFPTQGPIASSLPERPFLSNPSTCVGPQTTRLVTLAYDHRVRSGTAPWPATTGCDQLGFNPALSAKPSTGAADTASGLDVTLNVPQKESPVTPSDSAIKETVVTMPVGFSINPSAADGKVSCSDAQARLGTTFEAECPEHAKVGIAELDSWALPTSIPGAIYLGDPKPGDRYRLIIVADGYGTHIKLPGSVSADPQTGQLTVTFENLPQAPLTQFDMHLFGSERGLLATPTKCGTYAVDSHFVPWATGLPAQESTQFFVIDKGPNGSPCPGAQRPFAPGFRAVGGHNGAGEHSPFSIYLTRQDGDQTLSTIGAKTPPGFSATLKGVPRCSDADIAATSSAAHTGRAELASSRCPAGSQVGVTSAAAGAGSRPYHAPGKVYLAGPYRGAPLSFVVVTPAVSGPYDLGNVVNRVAVRVDPSTAQVTAVSDPLPEVIEGIPLRIRSVLLNLDRSKFTINPTNCNPFDVEGLITGTEGGKANPSTHYQVANCGTLDFAPKLTTTLSGGTKRTQFPSLKAVLTQRNAGEANVSRAIVTLPHSEFLEQSHIGTICTRVQYAADSCPAASVYGRASVVTPLLDQPLTGPVYLRSSSNPLPDLVAALEGPASQPIEIDLVGRIDSTVWGGIRTTFSAVPDAPVSRFVLQMRGGKKGLLVNSDDLCKGVHRVRAKLLGQNGVRADQNPILQAPCKAKAGGQRTSVKRGGSNR
jgi:hypothetical protein